MKNKKRTMRKALLLVCSALVLVCLSVGATVAYLTAEKSVTNTFTFGDVQIKLDETKVDKYGVAVQGTEGGRKETGNEFKLIPGHTYVKDPMVTVLGKSEPCFVRMLVTVSDYEDLAEVFNPELNKALNTSEYWNGTDDYLLLEKFVSGWNSEKWKSVKVTKNSNNSATYEFRYSDIVDTRDGNVKPLENLFTKFTLPEFLNNDQVKAISEMEITVEAHAIQADTFGNDADAAWAAFVPNP